MKLGDDLLGRRSSKQKMVFYITSNSIHSKFQHNYCIKLLTFVTILLKRQRI